MRNLIYNHSPIGGQAEQMSPADQQGDGFTFAAPPTILGGVFHPEAVDPHFTPGGGRFTQGKSDQAVIPGGAELRPGIQ
jgi:hypothetical protein